MGRGCDGVAGVLLFFMSLSVLVREVKVQQKIKKQTLKTHTKQNTTKTSKTSVIAKDAPITNYVLTITA